PNKRFKTDSQRVAFVVCGKFSDLGGMRKHRYCVAHHLSGRYVYLYFKDLKVLGSSSLFPWQFVPSRLSKSALSA
ncbi:hypothetical protein, partial [Vibrio parahaemolyticus]|uniref:hypothetical protein n=1 Tax=Vibrio parahaemolyticus TaxID=670 RepID=UPI003081104D